MLLCMRLTYSDQLQGTGGNHGGLGRQQCAPPASRGRSKLVLFQSSECQRKSPANDDAVVITEYQIAVSNHTVARQYASSASSVRKVKAKAEAT